MLTIYKTTEQGLGVFDDVLRNCWIHVVNPSPQEIERLQSLGIPPEFVTYPLDIDERSRVEKEDGHMLILLRVPPAQGPTWRTGSSCPCAIANSWTCSGTRRALSTSRPP